MPSIPPDGSLWRETGRADVYWIRDGQRLHIPNPYVMEALGLDWNAVAGVAVGGLDHVPIDDTWTPIGQMTPGSVVHVGLKVGFLGLSGRVYWPNPIATSKRLVAWGEEVRTVQLQGWLHGEGGANLTDPDFSYWFEIDAEWALSRGIDLSELVRVGNILQLPAEAGAPQADGSNYRSWCAAPEIKVEIVGWPPKGQRDRKQPPDWQVFDATQLLDADDAGANNHQPVRWPFDPAKPAPGNAAIPDGSYVRICGAIVTDVAHATRPDDPYLQQTIGAWSTAPQNHEDDRARWTEIHPPDWIEVLPPRPPQTLPRGPRNRAWHLPGASRDRRSP